MKNIKKNVSEEIPSPDKIENTKVWANHKEFLTS